MISWRCDHQCYNTIERGEVNFEDSAQSLTVQYCEEISNAIDHNESSPLISAKHGYRKALDFEWSDAINRLDYNLRRRGEMSCTDDLLGIMLYEYDIFSVCLSKQFMKGVVDDINAELKKIKIRSSGERCSYSNLLAADPSSSNAILVRALDVDKPSGVLMLDISGDTALSLICSYGGSVGQSRLKYSLAIR